MQQEEVVDWFKVWEEIKQDPSYPPDVDFRNVMYTYEQLCFKLPIPVLVNHMYHPKYMFQTGDCLRHITDRINDEYPRHLIHYAMINEQLVIQIRN